MLTIILNRKTPLVTSKNTMYIKQVWILVLALLGSCQDYWVEQLRKGTQKLSFCCKMAYRFLEANFLCCLQKCKTVPEMFLVTYKLVSIISL